MGHLGLLRPTWWKAEDRRIRARRGVGRIAIATGFGKLIDMLTDASIEYLCGQVSAGADALQIFDSWAGSLADDEFERWVIGPTAKLVQGVRKRHPGVPIIGFPRGAAALLDRYIAATGVDGVSCDTACPLSVMQRIAKSGTVVQGNLDPLLLVSGGAALDQRIDEFARR